eukprot:13058172-Alexandrium_andersonii.AAC.1
MIPSEKRWLLPLELALAQGFPVRPSLANPRGCNHRCCSFAAEDGSDSSGPDRSRNAVAHQSGNSMNPS